MELELDFTVCLDFIYKKFFFVIFLRKKIGGFYEVDVMRTYDCAIRRGEEEKGAIVFSFLPQKRKDTVLHNVDMLLLY